MRPSSRSFPDRERAELADLLERVGPDAPTCCAGGRAVAGEPMELLSGRAAAATSPASR